MFTSRTFTAGSPRNPSVRPWVYFATSAFTVAIGRCLAAATRLTWMAAFCGEMPGSRPVAAARHHRAVGLLVEGQLRDADHDGRVDEPEQHGEHQQGAERRDVLPDEDGKAVHAGHPNPGMFIMMRSMSLIPMNGMIRPPA